MAIIALVVFGVTTLLGLVAFVAWRYQRVPADKVLVVYGTGGRASRLFIGSGGSLVLPIVEGHGWLDLTPLRVPIDGQRLRSSEGDFVDVRGHVVAQISIDPTTTARAAERLLNLERQQIADLVTDIAFGIIRETLIDRPATSSDTLDLGGHIRPELEHALANLGLDAASVSLEVVPAADL